MPALTLALVLTNNAVQSRIAEANAAKIVKACEEFHAANGKYPKTLGELVPKYLSSVPHAKYCLVFGEFLYSDKSQYSCGTLFHHLACRSTILRNEGGATLIRMGPFIPDFSPTASKAPSMKAKPDPLVTRRDVLAQTVCGGLALGALARRRMSRRRWRVKGDQVAARSR